MNVAPRYAAEPAAQPQSFWQRRGVGIALRVLALLVGIAGSAMCLFSAGLISLFAACGPEATGLCTNLAALVPVLEWAIVILATLAPLAGAIASCWRREWPWLPAGLVTGALLVGLAVLVASGQTGTLG